MSDGYVGVVAQSERAGTAIASSVSETSLLAGTAGVWSMPGGYVDRRGKRFRLTAHGKISTVVTTPGTLTLRLKGGSAAVGSSQAIPLNIVAKSNVAWWLDLMIVSRDLGDGTGTTFMVQGRWTSEANIGAPAAAAGAAPSALWQPSAPAVGTGINASIANIMDLTAQWSVNSGSNSITCEDYCLESLN